MQELHGAAVVGKTHIYSDATLNTEEIKPVALAIIVLCLSEVSQSVSQCKIRFLNKIISTLWKGIYSWSEDIFGLGFA